MGGLRPRRLWRRGLRGVVAVLLAASATLIAAATAHAHEWQAGSCGLPTSVPMFVEYAEVGVSKRIRHGVFGSADPPLVLATSGERVPQQLRAGGAHTVFWHMNLYRHVGYPNAPMEPAIVEAAAERLFQRAVVESNCSTPVIAINELQGGWLRTPWSSSNQRYRANVLAYVRRLSQLGARPVLLVPTNPRPFTDSPEAVEWWRSVAEVADLVLEVHFSGREAYKRGPLVGPRSRRLAMRRALRQFDEIGILPRRLGLLHGFQTRRGAGGREGLRLKKWLRVVVWEAVAAREVAAERASDGKPLASVWSWGWGDFTSLAPRDPDKPLVACVYLWARDPSLCNAPRRLSARGLRLPNPGEARLTLHEGTACTVSSPRFEIGGEALSRMEALRGELGGIPRATAVTALFARTVFGAVTSIPAEDVLSAEAFVVTTAFGGSAEAYAAALAIRGADVDVARGVLLDQLLRRRLSEHTRARLLARALEGTTCVRDELPALIAPDLTYWLPFLQLP